MTGWEVFKSWAFTLDHKRIGVMYLCGVMFAFLLGGLYAGHVRMELWDGTPNLVSENMQESQDAYNQAFTLHGAIMTFLFIIPSARPSKYRPAPQIVSVEERSAIATITAKGTKTIIPS
ncbi:MAG: cbb3-type cytochrome c oxidase subunit I, partial [Planctomycetota bacterium]